MHLQLKHYLFKITLFPFFSRFNYESELYPKFSDVKRTHMLDAEVSASGITRQMEKDILREMGILGDSEDEEEDSEHGSDNDQEDIKATAEEEEEDLEELRKEFEDAVTFAPGKELKEPTELKEAEKSRSVKEAESSSEKETNSESVPSPDKELKEIAVTVESPKKELEEPSEEAADKQSYPGLAVSDCDEDEEDCGGEAFANLHQMNKGYKPFRDDQSFDMRSVRSGASTVASIAPSEVKKRIRASFARRQQLEDKRRLKAKGEASAVTRQRRDNRENIKTSTSAIWMG